MPASSGPLGLPEIYVGYGGEPALQTLLGRSIMPARIVLGAGPDHPAAVLLGEAPGHTEQRLGLPFAGPAGQMLNKLLAARGIERDELFVTNAVKIKPPQNRAPEDDELDASRPYLMRELDFLHPYMKQPVLVAMGGTAATIILDRRVTVSSVAGTVKQVLLPTYQQRDGGVVAREWTVLFTYHPAAALRSADARGALEADLGKLAGMIYGG